MGTTVLAVLAFVAGSLLLVATLLSAIMTVVVPRALPVITRWVFTGIRVLFGLRGGGPGPLHGPVSLFGLAATWLVLTGIGSMLLFWSLGERPPREALVLDGRRCWPRGWTGPAAPTQLRSGAAGDGRPDHGPVCAVVLGRVHDHQGAAPPAAQPLQGVSRFAGPGAGAPLP